MPIPRFFDKTNLLILTAAFLVPVLGLASHANHNDLILVGGSAVIIILLALATHNVGYSRKEQIRLESRLRQSEARLAEELVTSKALQDLSRDREAELNQAQRLAHIGSWHWEASTEAITGTEELYRIYGLDPYNPPFPALRDQDGQ